MRELARGQPKDLSAKAKFRLTVFDWYYQKSPALSITGVKNGSLTCRHFGIQRSLFYYWLKRYNKQYLQSLENKSRAPKQKRKPEYSQELVAKVRKIRKADPTYSAKKIRPILLRELAEVPSVATLGRLIRRNNLFFRPDTKLHKKRSRTAKQAYQRLRKPANLYAVPRLRLSSST